MCMSPDEMTSARIEQALIDMRVWLEDPACRDRNYWDRRVENFEKLLKDRAEDGTYATAGVY